LSYSPTGGQANGQKPVAPSLTVPQSHNKYRPTRRVSAGVIFSCHQERTPGGAISAPASKVSPQALQVGRGGLIFTSRVQAPAAASSTSSIPARDTKQQQQQSGPNEREDTMSTPTRQRPSIGDLVRGLKDFAWPLKPNLFEPTAPDLTLLFKAQARLAGVPESAIHATAGYYRAIAPTLNMEQLHQLALLFNDEFEAGVAVGEGAKRGQQGE